MSYLQILGMGRDLFLIAASAFFSAFVTWQIARRRFSAAMASGTARDLVAIMEQHAQTTGRGQ